MGGRADMEVREEHKPGSFPGKNRSCHKSKIKWGMVAYREDPIGKGRVHTTDLCTLFLAGAELAIKISNL
jgi:hypothetical protein